MTLPIDGDGLTFRLLKNSTDGKLTLIARNDETGETEGSIPFENMQEARDVADAVTSALLNPPACKGFNISLHG